MSNLVNARGGPLVAEPAADRGDDRRDRRPPTGPGIGPEQGFATIWNQMTRLFASFHDEAMRDNPEEADAMGRDDQIATWIEDRILPTATLQVQVVPDNPRDKAQAESAARYARMIESTPGLLDLKENLLYESVYRGRGGYRITWEKRQVDGRTMWAPRPLAPISGDKINFQWDGVPAILVRSTWLAPADWPEPDLRYSDRAGGKYLVLSTPFYRDRFVICQGTRRDRAFRSEGDLAGAIYGQGVRSFLYFAWKIKQAIVKWQLDAAQRYSANGLLYAWVDSGNPQAEGAMLEALAKLSKDTVAVFKRMPGGVQQEIGSIPANTASSDVLMMMNDYFDRRMQAHVVGSADSTPVSRDPGGDDEAQDLRQAYQKGDKLRLGESLTRDLLNKSITINEGPDGLGYGMRVSLLVNRPDVVQILEAAQRAMSLGLSLDEADLREKTGLKAPESPEDALKPPMDAAGMPGPEGKSKMAAPASADGGEPDSGKPDPPEGGFGPNHGRKAADSDNTATARYGADGIFQEPPGSKFGLDGQLYDLNALLRLTHGRPWRNCEVGLLRWAVAGGKVGPKDIARVAAADTSCSILVARDAQGRPAIVDGEHRLDKAIIRGLDHLPAIDVTAADLDACRLAPSASYAKAAPAHAPAGGDTVGGKAFKGGQFQPPDGASGGSKGGSKAKAAELTGGRWRTIAGHAAYVAKGRVIAGGVPGVTHDADGLPLKKVSHAPAIRAGDPPRAKPKAADRAPHPLVEVAASSGSIVGKAEHLAAEAAEKEIAGALGATHLDDHEPVDAVLKGRGGAEHGIEIKTLSKGKKQALTMHDDALFKKLEYAQADPRRKVHTIAVDLRDSFEGGAHADKYSGHGLYYRRGARAYTLGSMHKVKDHAELRRLVAMDDADLPPKARGSLPEGDEAAALEGKAINAHAARLAKDRALKARKKAAKLALAAAQA